LVGHDGDILKMVDFWQKRKPIKGSKPLENLVL